MNFEGRGGMGPDGWGPRPPPPHLRRGRFHDEFDDGYFGRGPRPPFRRPPMDGFPEPGQFSFHRLSLLSLVFHSWNVQKNLLRNVTLWMFTRIIKCNERRVENRKTEYKMKGEKVKGFVLVEKWLPALDVVFSWGGLFVYFSHVRFLVALSGLELSVLHFCWKLNSNRIVRCVAA